MYNKDNPELRLKDPKVAADKIIITESPIDALSHKQMHQEPNSTIYLSTCGSLSEGIKKELKNLLASVRENGPLIVLAFDKDTTGQQMQKEVSNLANDQQIKVQEAILDQGKDWNQTLQNQLDFGQQHNLRRFQKALAMSGQEYELRKRNKREPNVLGMEIAIDGL
ncbi:Toprim-like/Toprim domain [Cardinium endosymbiont of Sogatella furcifera]|uniref:toprim domain-containing protein n=1 Tax=Cardinium endosymbiont of Sogatella furcifera TaxID=650378 RepID=UPI000E0D48FB|nr:toprim domain-containing protein [Cardinium endosymbiont of Sogatella furcifera]AXI24410.1 Toprim-like/Toprim domain [Cardinium endosymbiont of Sogatella furcifera]